MLFDPFEEQFDLPAAAIQLGNRVCGQGKIVGKEHQLLAGFRVGHLDSAEFVRIVLGGVEAGEDDGLVAREAGLFVDGSGIEAAVAPIGLGADDEEGRALMGGVEAAEVQVAAVHQVNGTRFGQ